MDSRDENEAEFVLWWDAQPAWQVFMDLSSPWKYGFDGITGIDDVAIIAVIDLYPVPKKDRLELFRDVQAVLRGGLKYIDELRAKRARQ